VNLAHGDAYIGLDLGTSGLKGIALDITGSVLARASASYATLRTGPETAEQDPAAWIAAIRAVAGQLAADVPPARWRVIGLAAMIPTLVTADRNGDPTGPAVTWQDNRAQEAGEAIRERCGGHHLYQATGQWLDGRYLLPMFAHLAATDPGRVRGARWLLGAKDYLFHWLTGTVATDPSTAAGSGCYELSTGRWHAPALAAARELASMAVPGLPHVLPSTAVRPLRKQATAALGCGPVPVCVGAADSVLGAFGLGVREPGQLGYIAGTSNVILGVSHALVFDPQHRFLVTPLAEPGRWGLEMDLLATGAAISWLAGLFGDGLDEAAVLRLATGADPAQAPLMLPYLSPGEQGALWDRTLTGAFLGLTLRHTRQHLARGLVNGIVLESRRCLAVLDEAGDFGADLRVAGTSAADPGFLADLADATGRNVVLPDDLETDYSARGAAFLAALAVDTRQPEAAAGSGPVVKPGATGPAKWEELWQRYETARMAITGWADGDPASRMHPGDP
jgi:xylulokinase